MDIAMVGLGKMGGNMAERLARGGHRVLGFDLDAAAVAEAASEGVVTFDSVPEMVASLASPRVVWMMVPAGDIVDRVIADIAPALQSGDVIVDGGNSNYKDTVRRSGDLLESGIHLVDVGTSGGVWGLAEGYSMMAGGADDAIAILRPALETLAPTPDTGWGHVGASGSGHFVKMIHNGIEYGLMEAYAEGFALLRAKDDFGLDLAQVADIWRTGSVVRSWLLDLTARALAENPTMEGIAPYVPDSGEGRWTVFEAIDLNVEAPVIALSLMRRIDSRDPYDYSDRLLSAMRNQFGGHDIKADG
jgi:6-phosphogluconate dehydrogenase